MNSMASSLASVDVLGIRVDDITAPNLLDLIESSVCNGQRLMVLNSNIHLINLAFDRPWLRQLFAKADIAFCDGAGVQFAVWGLTGCKPSRHTPPEWIVELAQRLARRDGTVYWLGGRPEVVSTAAARLEQATGLRTVGWHHGFFDRQRDGPENEAVIADINSVCPDLLLLAMGMPAQEEWLHLSWDRVDAKVAISSGALVDHVAGLVQRPPPWVANSGLEWLVRLAIEPRRPWRRYLVGLPLFLLRIAPHLMQARLQPDGKICKLAGGIIAAQSKQIARGD